MRIWIVILTSLLYSQFSFAQTNFRFADPSAIWNLSHAALMEGPAGIWSNFMTKSFSVGSDTVIHNLEYQIIAPGFTEPAAYVRKDTLGKVYLYDQDLQAEVIIYDFSLTPGDTFTYFPAPSSHSSLDTMIFVVDSIDYISMGFSRKRIFFHAVPPPNYTWSNDLIIIEGIGALNTHFLRPFGYENYSIPGERFNLLCFTENSVTHNIESNCYVGIEDHFYGSTTAKIFPNPFSQQAILEVSLGNKKVQDAVCIIYDLQGRLIEELKPQQQTYGKFKFIINSKNIIPGTYFYKIVSNNEVIARGKMVRE